MVLHLPSHCVRHQGYRRSHDVSSAIVVGLDVLASLLVDKEGRVSVTFVVTVSSFVSVSGIDPLVISLSEVSG